MKYEEEFLKRIESSSKELDAKRIALLRDFFVRLREIGDQVSSLSPKKLYEAQQAVLGLISRAYQLMLSSIDSIALGNWNAFHACARGLVETTCAAVWAKEDPARLPSLIQFTPLKTGRVLNAGYRAFPNLKELYQELSGVVHPNRDSHVLSWRNRSEWESTGLMTPFYLGVSDYLANQQLLVLDAVAPILLGELSALRDLGADDLLTGRVMAFLPDETKEE